MAGVLKIETIPHSKEENSIVERAINNRGLPEFHGKIKLPEEGVLTDFHNYADTTLTARGYLDQLFKRQMM